MILKPVAFALATVALLSAGTGAAQQTFRGEADTVALYATVTDARGGFVAGLTKADFEVLDNGVSREISVFSAETPPLTGVLLLDMMGSWLDVPWLRDAGVAFVEGLHPRDRIRLATFGDEIAISPRLTGDRAYLTWVLREELWAAGTSPLWLAIDEAMSSIDRETGRRVVVVLTNGTDVRSPQQPRRLGAAEVTRRAESEGVTVFVVGFEREVMTRSLLTLAAVSGGRVIKTRDLSGTPGAFAAILRELHSQYLVGFAPSTLDGKAHTIDLRVRRPGLTASTRTRYQALRPLQR